MKIIGSLINQRAWVLPLVVISTIIIYWFYQVFKSPYANGFDGYYYVMQLDTLLKNGVMHSRDFSLIYLPLILFSLLFKPLLSYKITVAIIGVIFTLSSYYFVKSRSNKNSAQLVMLFTLCSPSVLFFLLQFPKNLLGCVLLLATLTSYKNKKTIPTMVFLLISIFAHRLTFVLLICSFISDQLLFRLNRKVTITIIILTIFSLVTPGLLNIFDYKRILGDEIRLFSYWGQVSFMNIWDLWRNPSWVFDFIFCHLLIILALINVNRREPLLLFLTLFLIPIFKYSTGSLSYRLYLNAYLLIPIISFSYFNNNLLKKLLIFLLTLSLLLTLLPRYDINKFNPPISLYKELTTAIDESLDDLEVDMIIAHKGIKEQIILETDHDASNWKPEIVTEHTYRVFVNINDYLLLKYLSPSEVSKLISLPAGYYLIKESIFIDLINDIKNNEPDEIYRSIDSWQNPLNLKPLFLQ